MSPPARLAMTGRTHRPENPSMTRGVAKPDSLTARPNNVSDGTLLCARIATVNASGAAAQAASTARVLAWLQSFDHSTAVAETIAPVPTAILAPHQTRRCDAGTRPRASAPPTPSG